MASESYWYDTVKIRDYPPLKHDLTVDALVIGGGNTGVSAGYLLKKEGLKVALIERGRFGGVDTSHTSAHLTYVTDLRVRRLFDKLGHDHAAAVFDAGDAAMQQIEKNIAEQEIDCDFSHVPGYLHASLIEKGETKEELQKEARLARELGYPGNFVNAVPLFHLPGVRFANQARFHPLKYLSGLLNAIPGSGSHVFGQTESEDFGEKKLEVKANGHTIKCGFVVIATDVPLQGKTGLVSATLFQTKIIPYTSYVIGAKIPKGAVPDALFWDTSDPYFFFRLQRQDNQDYAIFGGADHKTGQMAEPKNAFDELEKVLLRFLPEAKVDHRWSGQVIEAIDGLPYIGEISDRQFIATGFSGNGLTFGSLGAMMACDAAMNRKNPWQALFDPNRKKLSALWNYLKENSDYPYYMLKDRLAKSEGESVRGVKRGEGKILTLKNQRTAVFRDSKGKVTKLSPVCTHMGCIVHWNDAEKTWDCPCHGSRFEPTGEVLAGPAETPLEPIKNS